MSVGSLTGVVSWRRFPLAGCALALGLLLSPQAGMAKGKSAATGLIVEAAPADSAAIAQRLDAPLKLELKDTDLAAALDSLARTAQLKVTLDAAQLERLKKYQVSQFTAKECPTRAALDALTSAAELSWRTTDQGLRLEPADRQARAIWSSADAARAMADHQAMRIHKRMAVDGGGDATALWVEGGEGKGGDGQREVRIVKRVNGEELAAEVARSAELAEADAERQVREKTVIVKGTGPDQEIRVRVEKGSGDGQERVMVFKGNGEGEVEEEKVIIIKRDGGSGGEKEKVMVFKGDPNGGSGEEKVIIKRDGGAGGEKEKVMVFKGDPKGDPKGGAEGENARVIVVQGGDEEGDGGHKEKVVVFKDADGKETQVRKIKKIIVSDGGEGGDLDEDVKVFVHGKGMLENGGNWVEEGDGAGADDVQLRVEIRDPEGHKRVQVMRFKSRSPVPPAEGKK